jgi:hypothetical protein
MSPEPRLSPSSTPNSTPGSPNSIGARESSTLSYFRFR